MGLVGSKSKTRKVTVSPTGAPGNERAREFKPETEDSFGEFHKLPKDLILLIFSQLVAADIARLSMVSKGLHSVASSEKLWKAMYERKWGRGAFRKSTKSVDWKTLYWKRVTNNQDPREDPYWDTIMEHRNDTSLDSDFASHTWTLKVSPGTSYRAFRVIQTGKNKYQASKGQKDEWSDVLVMSGFEIYGYLTDANASVQVDGATVMEDGRRRLTFTENLDKKGAINFLGGHPNVQVYSSSITPGKYVESFISTEDVYVWTRNEKLSWFGVDLGEGRSLEPTEYTLRYGSGGNYCCPRNWLLQGTNFIEVLRGDFEDPTQDPKWDTLSVHEDDKTLDGDWAVHTWPLNIPENQSYRIFRIIQTGKNKYQVPTPGQKDSWSDVLVVSGFELYGTVVERSKRKKQPKERNFEHKYDMDRNGIIYGLGGYPVVKVYSSSLYSGKNVVNFISKDLHHNWTLNEKFAWFAVDFGKDRTVKPTHYTLRYGSGGNLCCPRNWLLQGSNDADVLKVKK